MFVSCDIYFEYHYYGIWKDTEMIQYIRELVLNLDLWFWKLFWNSIVFIFPHQFKQIIKIYTSEEELTKLKVLFRFNKNEKHYWKQTNIEIWIQLVNIISEYSSLRFFEIRDTAIGILDDGIKRNNSVVKIKSTSRASKYIQSSCCSRCYGRIIYF